MIVGKFFEGDDDTEVAWKQHEVYHQALGSIVQTSNRLTLFARYLLGDKSHANWGKVESCDHRTLQGAHDLLAAAWRFRNDFRQSALPLERMPGTLAPHTPENLWLWWLHDEIEKWVLRPELVQDVQLILNNQNQPVGFAAESRLCLALLDRFHHVPWRPELRNAYERDIKEDMDAKIENCPEPNKAAKTVVGMPCECTLQGFPACYVIPCETTAARATRQGWGTLE